MTTPHLDSVSRRDVGPPFPTGGRVRDQKTTLSNYAIKTTLFTGKGRKNEESTRIIITLLLTLGDEFSSKKMEDHRLDR